MVDRMLQRSQDYVFRYPIGFSKWLCAFDSRFQGISEIAILGDISLAKTHELLAVTASAYLPHTVLAAASLPLDPDAPDLLHNRQMIDEQPTAYVCKQFVCKQPVTTAVDLAQQLKLDFPMSHQGA